MFCVLEISGWKCFKLIGRRDRQEKQKQPKGKVMSTGNPPIKLKNRTIMKLTAGVQVPIQKQILGFLKVLIINCTKLLYQNKR